MRRRKHDGPPVSGSLASQRDYYRRQAETADPKDRPLWRQLADELTVRLGEAGQTWAPEEPLIR